jgi:hypothetical protein
VDGLVPCPIKALSDCSDLSFLNDIAATPPRTSALLMRSQACIDEVFPKIGV